MSSAVVPGSVYAALDDLVAYLVRLAARDERDAALAGQAAENIRATVAELDAASTPAAVASALDRVRYDIGGKGIHDWIWSPATQDELRQLTERVRQALDAPRRGVAGRSPAT